MIVSRDKKGKAWGMIDVEVCVWCVKSGERYLRSGGVEMLLIHFSSSRPWCFSLPLFISSQPPSTSPPYLFLSLFPFHSFLPQLLSPFSFSLFLFRFNPHFSSNMCFTFHSFSFYSFCFPLYPDIGHLQDREVRDWSGPPPPFLLLLFILVMICKRRVVFPAPFCLQVVCVVLCSMSSSTTNVRLQTKRGVPQRMYKTPQAVGEFLCLVSGTLSLSPSLCH